MLTDTRSIQTKLHNLAMTSPHRERYPAKEAKEMLLQGGCITCQGKAYSSRAKNLGAGVWEVWVEEK